MRFDRNIMPEQEKQSWTIKSLQEWCTSHLKEKGFESARLTTDLLLAHTLKCERIQLYAHFDKPLSQQELELFKILYKRRLENEPLQYIIGEAQFMGFTFYVDKRVLIPRPETEILVQETVQPIKEQPEKMFRVLDVGTGSGNIAISLAHLVNNIQLDAIDISDDALSVAEKNIQRHNVGSKVRLLKADAMNVPAEISTNKYDIIVSNPPYISNKEFALLSSDVKNYEPALALNDYSDGLTFYKTLSKLGVTLLQQGGMMFVEIAYNQSYDVKRVYEQDGYSSITIIPDLNKIPRIVKAQRGTP